jgi:type I restriction enzyme S subunit
VMEIMAELPPSWLWIKLEELCTVQTGLAKNTNKTLLSSFEVPYLRVANVQDGYLDLEEVKTIFATEEQVERYGLQKGDVLFCEGGDYDKVGRGCVWNGQVNPCLHQNHVFAVRCGQYIDPRYLSFARQTKFAKQYFLSASKQTTNLASINSTQLKNFLVPFCNPIEQRRIVEKIETLFTQLDAGVAALQYAKAQLKRYRQAVLKAAFSGELTAAWRKKHLPQECSTDGDREELCQLSAIPAEWRWVKLEQYCTVQTGIAKNATKNLSKPVTLPYLRVANVQDGYLDLTEIKEITIDEEKVSRYSLQAGDVLFCEGGDFDKVGRGHVWEGQITPCLHQNHVFVVKCGPEINPYFLSLARQTEYAKKYFLNASKQTTNLASINSTQLKALPIPLCGLEEQNELVKLVEEAFSEAEYVEKTIDDSLLRAEVLRQSILKQAFSGKLVPQDPADEPASVLLERLQAETAAKAEQAKAKKPSKGKTKTTVAQLEKLLNIDEMETVS